MPRQKTSKIVKSCQNFLTLFDNFRAGQKSSKVVEKCQKYFRHFSTIFARHQFSGPFWGALTMASARYRLRGQTIVYSAKCMAKPAEHLKMITTCWRTKQSMQNQTTHSARRSLHVSTFRPRCPSGTSWTKLFRRVGQFPSFQEILYARINLEDPNQPQSMLIRLPLPQCF